LPSPAVAPVRRSAARQLWVCSLVVGGIIASAIASAPASAQFAGSLSIDSDDRLRGYSVSDDRPVASLNLSYDLPSGLYANGSVIATLDHADNVHPLGVIANLGYARSVDSGLSLDAGITQTQYYRYVAATGGDAHYTDFYVGVLTPGLSSHLYLSPDDLHRGVTSLYGEIDGALRPIRGWRLSAHIGAIGYLAAPGGLVRKTHYDWRAGVARRLGPFDVHAAITGGGPGNDYYLSSAHHRAALVGGASWVF